MSAALVTVLMPVYNEQDRLLQAALAVKRALDQAGIPFILMLLNDGSSDQSQAIARNMVNQGWAQLINFPENIGKGGVLNEAFKHLHTPYTVIIDADNEYEASEIPRLLQPLMDGSADWVMGSRYGFARPRPQQYLATWLVNRLINAWFRLWSGLRFHDLLTGLYGFTSDMVSDISLQECRFAYTPEILWKVARTRRPRWREFPASYHFRTYQEGKSIRWWETFTILFAIVKYKYTPATRTHEHDAA